MRWTTEELQYLYDTHTLTEVGYLLGWSRSSKNGIRKLLQLHGISIRPCGMGHTGGNRKNTGVKIPEEILRAGLPDKEVGKMFNTSYATVKRARIRLGLRRKQPYTEDRALYESQVRRLSEKTYRKHKATLNPNDYPRGKMGVDGAYQLDHIKPISRCYDEGVGITEAASLHNLQFISWEDNLDKREYSK